MLTFMNSELTKMTGKDKQNYIFRKNKSYEISSTNLKKMQYPPQKKKKLLKRNGNSITVGKTNAPISQTSWDRFKQLTIQTYQMRNKELKIEAWTTSRGNIKSIFAS